MPMVGPMEILVIAAIALIVFGPEKLPEIARQIGRASRELRRMASEVKDEFEGFDLNDDDPPKRQPRHVPDPAELTEPPEARASEEPIEEPEPAEEIAVEPSEHED